MTTYSQQAAQNLQINALALGYAIQAPAVDAWLPARDGALSGQINGHWLAGCSVPKRSAEMMLRKYQFKGSVGCLLCPTHAHQIRTVFDRMDETQALIIILPENNVLSQILSCDDFSKELSASRLHFCLGMQWEQELIGLYQKHSGMSVPIQFIKLPILDAAVVDPVIKAAQKIFSDLLTSTNQRTLTARNSWKSGDEFCIVAGNRFKLWNDAGWMLSEIFTSEPQQRVNPDLPLESAAVLVAERAKNAKGIITTDLGRADSSDLIHPNMPWICWITRARIPTFVATSPRDGLVLCDPAWTKIAQAAGWPANRIRVGGYPVSATAAKGQSISIIYDLPSLTAPADIQDYSSQRLIWEAVAHDLSQNPFAVGFDPTAYLQKVIQRNRLTDSQFPIQLFIDRIVIPAHILGVAQLLISKNMPVALYGSGWETHEKTKAFAKGAIQSRQDFNDAIASSKLLINHTLSNHFHPILAAGLPVVSSAHMSADAFLRAIQAPAPVQPTALFTPSIVRELIG